MKIPGSENGKNKGAELRWRFPVLRSTKVHPGGKFGQPGASVRRAANWAVAREAGLCEAVVWALFLKGF